MSDKKLTPDIRFAGFDQSWEERIFDKIAGRISQICNIKDLPRVEYEDIISEFGRLNKDIFFKRSTKTGLLFLEGDILFGKLRPYLKNWFLSDFKGVAVGDFWVFRALEDINNLYLFFLIQSDRFQSISNISIGTKMPRADWNIVSKTQFIIPHSTIEQTSIGTFFTRIDALITLNERKYDKLVSLKKSMLQKMFPRDGADVPEIRFAGFEEPWKMRKIGELTNILSASRVHKGEWATDGVPFFRSSDVVSAFKGMENERVFISFDLYKELIKTSGELEKGDILITGGGSIGIPYIVSTNEPLYSKDADLIWIKKSSACDSVFLYAYLTCQRFRNYISGISHVGTIAHYTIEQVKDTPIIMPSIDEQFAIGNYFEKLDRLITLQQSKIEKLKQLKKSLLEKMFV